MSSATTPVYDNNGNLIKDENNQRFVWDAWNRQVTIKNSSDTVIAMNGYDALNRKIKVVVNSTTTIRLFSSSWQLLEEKVDSNIKTRNVWSPAYVDAIVSRDRDTDANGTLDERLYASQDANFNVTAITNTGGTVQERYNETPFGVTTFRSSSWVVIDSSGKDWVFLHQAGQADLIGGLDFRNRNYSPTLGRWLQLDPAKADFNSYRYNNNDPTSVLDPFGLTECGPATAGKIVALSTTSPFGGRKKPNLKDAGIDFAYFLTWVPSAPISSPGKKIGEKIGDILRDLINKGSGNKAIPASDILKLKGLQEQLAANGGKASVWSKVECLQCQCTTWFQSIRGAVHWQWVTIWGPEWVECDIKNTNWANDRKEWPSDEGFDRAGNLLNLAS